jgi:PKD repeat protein
MKFGNIKTKNSRIPLLRKSGIVILNNDREIINFEWQIGTSTFSGTTTEFTFNENGEYQITLTATDNDGATSSTSTIIKVEPFSFAIITDLHIGRGYPDYDGPGFEDGYNGEDYYLTERLKNVVKWINENKDNIDCDGTKCPIQFLAVLGDIADTAEKSEFCKAKEILDKLEIPYIPLFGNHDVWPWTEEKEADSPKGEEFFEKIFWSTSSIPCKNATSSKNFEALIKEFNFQRDEANPKYKSFVFSYGGMNFIGLDFNSRSHVLSPGWKTGVKPDAELWQPTINWLKDCIKEHKICLKGNEGNKNIIFSHIPFVEDRTMAFSPGYFSPYGYMPGEFDEIKKIIEENKDKILANFGGHIHGAYPFLLPHLAEYFMDANKEYDLINGTHILTTEALMVSSNEKDEYLKEHDKGIIKIVKILGRNEVDFKTNEGKYSPNAKEGKEFIALNPYISFEYKIFPEQIYPCIFLKAHTFTKRENNLIWEIDRQTIGSGMVATHCGLNPGVYTIKLRAIDKETGEEEFITRKVEIKEGIIPKIIKIAEELKEKVELISTELGEKLTEFGRTMRDTVLIKVKHSPSAPVGVINVHFERATEDIDLTKMKADVDLKGKKSLLYMPEWPNIVEREKILFIPK